MNKDYSSEYNYHGVPSPWLQVRILRLLRYVHPKKGAEENYLLDSIKNILESCDVKMSEGSKNAMFSILFEIIGLIPIMDVPDKTKSRIVGLLGNYLNATETNVRYLALDAMCSMCSVGCGEQLKKYLPKMIASLREIDISVKRRALQILFDVCDAECCTKILTELLRFLPSSDLNIREEVIVKICLLAEKFAKTPQWYVDIMLQLTAVAGDFISESILNRIIRVIVNNDNVQVFAAKASFKYLQEVSWRDTFIRLSSYILGEYGQLIVGNPGSSPAEQVSVLDRRFRQVGNSTRALLLSTYAKYVNVFPELTDQLRKIFKDHLDDIDVEVQQRAIEYMHITAPDPRAQELMQVVLDALPPWEEVKTDAPGAAAGEDAAAATAADAAPAPATPAGAAPSIMDLLGDLSVQTTQSGTTRTTTVVNPALSAMGYTPESAAPSSVLDVLQSTFAASTPAAMSDTVLTPTIAEAANTINVLSSEMNTKVRGQWMRLSAMNEGVLYSDGTMEIGVKSEFHGNSGRVVLFFGNMTKTPVVGLSLSLNAIPQLQLQTQSLAQTVIGPETQVQHAVLVKCNEEFKDIMLMHVEWLHPATSTKVSIDLPFPVMLTKFLGTPAASAIAAPEFVATWKALSEPGMELQQVFSANSPIVVANIRKFLVDSYRMALLDGVDSKESNIVAIASLSVGTKQIPVLLRLETNAEAKMFRITLRTQSPIATNTLASFFMSQLSSL